MPTLPHHHSEWLSLLEISGPFLSMPVLLHAFPNGLDAHDPDHTSTLRAAHEEWLDNQNGLRPETAIHTAWVRYVLEHSLGYTQEVLLEGQAIPNGLRALIAEHGETLRPDYVLQAPGADSKPRLLIQVYPAGQKLDRPLAGSRWQASAAMRMMELLHGTGVRVGLVTNGDQWMLVDAPTGETTGYISWYAGLWFEENITLRAFRSLLSAYRFFGVPDAQTLEALLAASAQDQHEVTDQLGYQVRRAVEILVQAVDRADQDRHGALLAGLGTDQLYEAALTVMMRLVFLLSAEERKLLPSDDPFYAQYYAVSTLRAQLHEVADQTGEEVLERRYDAWSRLLATFRAVFSGVRHDRLTLPAHGGSLFDPDRYPFLVQADRYLAERLVEAWVALEEQHGIQQSPARAAEAVQAAEAAPAAERADSPTPPDRTRLLLTPEGLLTDDPVRAIPADAEDRLVFARRLVAERCLYGVDKNPLAVEIAKLSLWLVTLAKERPFTFVDHALKCGDSLVGADEKMFQDWAYSRRDSAFTLYHSTLEEMIELARQKRRELESFSVKDVRDAERKAALLKEADAAVKRVKLGCDLIVGVRLLGLKDNEQEELLEGLLIDYSAGLRMDGYEAQRALRAARKEQSFHWTFEFPEVFERGGFSAFVGNPPFRGGTRISSIYGVPYLIFLQAVFASFKSRADLCALFFLQAFKKLSTRGNIGLIATNTIAQADTKEAGLDTVTKNGGQIYAASTDLPWPGQAAVLVSVVHISKGAYKGCKYLNNQEKHFISTRLDSENYGEKPKALEENSIKSFTGSKLDGEGFVISEEEAKRIIEIDPKYLNVVFPYLRGEDFNTKPEQKPTFWVINFFDWEYEEIVKYPVCYDILQNRVYQDRQSHSEKRAREKWWQFQRTRAELYKSINSMDQVLFHPFTSKYLCFGFVPSTYIFAAPHVIIALSNYSSFSILQSVFHESWVVTYGSTLGTTLRYTTSDVFETFPFPYKTSGLEDRGISYHDTRQKLMLSRQEGLTATYNRFHNPAEHAADIARLRELHAEMDRAVAAAYGWDDLDLGHGFHETAQGTRFTISEPARREVLARLLKLNHERHEEEVRLGLHEGKKGKGSAGRASGKVKDSAPAKGMRAEPASSIAASPLPLLPADLQVTDSSQETTPRELIGNWDQCVCNGCGKHLAGFSIEEHTRKAHQGKDPGYRKVKGK